MQRSGCTSHDKRTYTYTIDLTTALVPPSERYGYSAATDPGAPATIKDACGRDVVPTLVGFVDDPATITCEGTRVYTYRYTACDGTTTADWTYTYTIDLTTALVPPTNGTATVECLSAATDPGAPATIKDACGRDVVPTLVGFVDDPATITCEGTRVYTYRYTACDGTTTADWTYTYTIDLTTALVPPTNGTAVKDAPDRRLYE